MRFIRFHLPKKGPRLGVLLDHEKVADFTGMSRGRFASFQELLTESEKYNISLSEVVKEYIGQDPEISFAYNQLAAAPLHSEQPHLLLPIIPPEVWAAGVAYKRSER